MIKKSIIVFSIFLTLTFVRNSHIHAQSTNLIPGVNCGVIIAPSTTPQPENKCCYYKEIKVEMKKPGIIGFDLIFDIVNGIVKTFTQEAIGPFKNLAQRTIQPCNEGTPSTPGNIEDPNCNCIASSSSSLVSLVKYCNNIVSAKEKTSCINCVTKEGGIWSGIGCVQANVKDFMQKTLLGWGVGLAGMFALLCIIYSSILMQTSQGNPERLKKAQELLTSCIMGLMLIIFSVFILRLIGVDILKIPGFR